VLAGTTIGVIGSGVDSHEDAASEVGKLLAGVGVNLLTGGGRGVMTSVSRAFTQSPRRRGICIGVIPSASFEQPALAKPDYPNPFVELAIYTHLPLSGDRGRELGSRNHINVLSSDAIIALPGSDGTVSEVLLALEYGKPTIAYARDLRAFDRFPSAVPRTSQLDVIEEFVRGIC
jgi:uncharacterized protein (TIGR00725 family)